MKNKKVIFDPLEDHGDDKKECKKKFHKFISKLDSVNKGKGNSSYINQALVRRVNLGLLDFSKFLQCSLFGL